MRLRRTVTSLLAGVMLVGCTDLDVTDPNRTGSDQFWSSEDDAMRAVAATYNSLLQLGTYSRWHIFAHDIRSDIGRVQSPWGDLAAFGQFQMGNYDVPFNFEIWMHNFEMVRRANLVIANVPGIGSIAQAERDRMVGEAKFLRALAYYNLVTLYDNVPLILEPHGGGEQVPDSPPEAVFAQIEQDLIDAAAVLPDPDELAGDERGRATKWAALAKLGRVRMQMAGVVNLTDKWGEAADALGEVIGSNDYSLLPDYADNFRLVMDNVNPESVFEVNNEDLFPIGVTGMSFPKMIGPCYRPGGDIEEFNPTYCDGRPTRWYFEEFSNSRTTSGAVDPRLDVTILYNRPDRATESVFGRPRGSFFVRNPAANPAEGDILADTMLFFRKYGEWETSNDQRWDNPINFKVIRYADVLLMMAEALNESGQTGTAFQYINQVRARVGKGALGGLSTAQLRDTILHERMFELGLEMSRFNDLRRHDLLTPALSAHDPEFAPGPGSSGFVVGKSERLPIPTTERNINRALDQNPGW